MKARFTFLMSMMAMFSIATLAQAPVVMDDFEGATLSPRYTGATFSLVEDPLSAGNKVLLSTERGGSGFFTVELTRNLGAADQFFTVTEDYNFDRMSIRFYATDGAGNPLTDNSFVSRVNGATDVHGVWETGNDRSVWQTVVFDITSETALEFFQPRPFHENASDASYRYYFDDITFYSSVVTSTNTPLASSDISVFPNPSNGATSLSVNLITGSIVKADVYSVTGELVQTLINEVLPSGNHNINFSVNSAGLYLVRVAVGNEVVKNLKLVVK